jgi:hypothetical protein
MAIAVGSRKVAHLPDLGGSGLFLHGGMVGRSRFLSDRCEEAPQDGGDLSGASRVLMGGPAMARESHHAPAIPPQQMNATPDEVNFS